MIASGSSAAGGAARATVDAVAADRGGRSQQDDGFSNRLRGSYMPNVVAG
jgi:hypothetical protein